MTLTPPYFLENEMHATAIPTLIKIDAVQGNGQILVVKIDGEHWQMYEAYRLLPVAVEFEGRTYQKTGWNSDNGEAYYQPRGLFARALSSKDADRLGY